MYENASGGGRCQSRRWRDVADAAPSVDQAKLSVPGYLEGLP